MGILDFLNPIKGVVGAVTGIIDTLTTSDEERLAAKAQLMEIERQFTSDMLAYEAKLTEERASVVRAEIASQSWMARNWRPIIMLLFGYIIMHNFVIAQLFSVAHLEIPPDMWGLLKLGMGGYIAGRSAEKIVPAALRAMRKPEAT